MTEPRRPRRWRLVRLLLGIASVALAGSALLVAVLALRLSRGPIDLEVLSPYLAEALSASDGAWRATVGQSGLAWDAEEHDLDLFVHDVRLTDANGDPLARVPTVTVRLRLAALLRGALRVRSVDVIGAHLRVRRDASGAWQVSASERQAPEAGEEPGGARVLLPSPAHGGPELIEVRHAAVVIEDAVTGLDGRLEDAHLEIRWRGPRLNGEASGGVTLGEQVVPVRLTFTREPPGAGVVEGWVERVDVARLGAWLDAQTPGTLAAETASPASAPAAGEGAPASDGGSTAPVPSRLAGALSRVRLAASLHVLADLDAELAPERAVVSVAAAGGEVALPVPGGLDVAITGATGRLAWTRSDGALVVEALDLDLGGPTVSLTGQRDGAGVVAATAVVSGFPVDRLARYWPATAAPGARRWLTTNLSAGRVDEATVRAAAVVPTDGSAPALRSLDGELSWSGLEVRYLDTMPPATAVKGAGTFSRDAWKLHVAGARVGDVDVTRGSVDVSGVGRPGTRVDVDATVQGALDAVLSVLDHPPLRVATSVGVDPAHASGETTGRLELGIPLDDRARRRALDVEAHATVDGGALSRALGDWSVTDAGLSVTVRDGTVGIKGTLRLAGLPVRLEWYDTRDVPGSRRVTATGHFDAAELAGLGLDTATWLQGPLVVEVTLGPLGSDRLLVSVDLTRARLDLVPIGLTKAPGAPGDATATLVVGGGALRKIAPAWLVVGESVVTARAAREPSGRWGTIQADAHVVAPAGDADYTLLATPSGTRHQVRFSCSDAAALMRATGRDVKGVGGKVTFDGRVGFDVPGLPFSGHVEVGRFTVMHDPVLASLLRLASLEGIADVFRKGGLEFEQAEVAVSREGDALRFEDGLAHGQFLIIMGRGTVEPAARRLDLRGSLIPSYFGLNRAANMIPLLGRLLTGSDGEGIAAIDFRIDGITGDPKVRVEPSSLGPGIVRDLLRELTG